MNKLFPLLIVALVVVVAGPFVTGYINGLTLDLANDTATQMQSALK